MLDIKLIRNHPEIVKQSLEKRRDSEKISWLMKVIKLDANYLKLKQNVEELRRQRNEGSREINELQKQGKDIKKKVKELKEIPQRIKAIEDNLEKTKEEINHYMMRLPNILHDSVPYGKDDSENKEVKKWGKIPKISYELKSHGELIEDLGIGNFDKAAEVSGAGFHYMLGDLSVLNLALMQFAVDNLIKKGFTLVTPPLMLGRKAYEGVTDLKDFENVMYKIEGEDLYMIATSEHPMAALFMNEVIPEEKLPLKLCGLSPCFRREIGSRGVDTKGLFRSHQFWKIEQFIFCKPEDSWNHHEEIQQNSEELYEKLEIPYRAVNICTGDIGTVAAKKYDIEAWFPRQQAYKEVGSNSNCTDYQARRLNIKFIDKNGDRVLVHTLNNTAIATSRVLVAILENYQQKDSSVKIPKELQKFTGFDKIEKKS